MKKKGYVIFDSNGAIKDRKSLKLVATSSGVDTLYVFADFDVSTTETAYRATVRIEKANGVIIGPHLLTLSQITEEEKAEFGVDYLACRKLEFKDKMLNVPGRLVLTIIYDQVDVNGKVLRTAAQGKLDEYVYDAVPEVPGEEELNDIRSEFIPRDLGDVTIADEFKDTDNIVVTQDGNTKKITGAELKEKIIDNIIKDEMIDEQIDNKLYGILDEKERQYTPRLTSVEAEINNVKNIKADKIELQAVASGSPKGVFPTSQYLDDAFPLGNNNIYITEDNGHWNYFDTVTERWVSGGIYQGVLNQEIINAHWSVIRSKGYSTLNERFEELESDDLLTDDIKGSIQVPIFDSNGNITELHHYKDSQIIRKDTFVYSESFIIEERKNMLNNNKIIYKYNIDTFEMEVTI